MKTSLAFHLNAVYEKVWSPVLDHTPKANEPAYVRFLVIYMILCVATKYFSSMAAHAMLVALLASVVLEEWAAVVHVAHRGAHCVARLVVLLLFCIVILAICLCGVGSLVEAPKSVYLLFREQCPP